MSEELSHEPTNSPTGRGRSVSRWAAILVVMLTVYVLSPVPLGMVLRHVPPAQMRYIGPVVEVVYKPVSVACVEIPAVRAFYDWQREFVY